MVKSSKRISLICLGLAVLVSFCLFALIPKLAQQKLPRQLPARRTPARLFTEPPPEPEIPKEQRIEEPEEQPLQQLQAQVPLKPKIVQAPELDYAPPRVALNMSTVGPPAPLSDLAAVYKPGDLDKAPMLHLHVKPLYPYRAQRMNITGYVVVEYDVRPDGTVGEIRILESNPPGIFDDAVLKAVRKWKYHPGELLGDQVTTRMAKKILFNLED
jgi:protein TonB